MPRFRILTCALGLAIVLFGDATSAAAQTGWLLPRTRHFSSPLADPLEPRFAVGLMTTDLLTRRGPERPPFVVPDSADASFDVVTPVALGGTFPLIRLAEWENGGIILAGQVGVFARFRIEYPSRDDLGQDWFISGPIEIRHGRYSHRVEIGHRSSHLGDEFHESTGASRIEFGHESLDALSAVDFGTARIYGGGSWIFRSNTQDVLDELGIDRSDRGSVQIGGDGAWYPWADGLAGFTAGVDVQAAERAAWKRQIAAAGGLLVRTGPRAARLIVRFFDGPSPLGEFFLTEETYWHLELNIDM